MTSSINNELQGMNNAELAQFIDALFKRKFIMSASTRHIEMTAAIKEMKKRGYMSFSEFLNETVSLGKVVEICKGAESEYFKEVGRKPKEVVDMDIFILNRHQYMIVESLNYEMIMYRLGEFTSLRFDQLRALVTALHPFSGYSSPASSEIVQRDKDIEAVINYFMTKYRAKKKAYQDELDACV